MRATGDALANLRDLISQSNNANHRLLLLDLSLKLESTFFTVANQVDVTIEDLNRRERLNTLSTIINALYGSGLIGKRQLNAALNELAALAADELSAADYKRTLDYLSLLPSWGTQNLRLFFAQAMNKLAAIEPKANLFIQDYLRGSPMFSYAGLIDGLVRDANQLIGVSNVLFGENVGAGYVHVGFGFLDHFLHDQGDLGSGDLVKMSLQSFKFTLDILPQG